MPSEGFHVTARPGSSDDIRILSVKGAISLSSSPLFQDAVAHETGPSVIIDLSEVPWIDSIAIGALVRAFVSCNRSGRKLALVGLNHRVRNVLQLTNIDPLFEIYPSIAEAEHALH
jgi:anti-sigma B factor antagonist